MNNKYFIIKFSGIAALILIIICYFLFYFIPVVKAINISKRQLKDMNLKIEDFKKVENKFAFSNSEEEALWAKVEKQLKGHIPEVKNREAFIQLFTDISNEIQKLAQRDGISNLVLSSNSEELKVNASSLSSDKKTLDGLLTFSQRRTNQFMRDSEDRIKTADMDFLTHSLSSLVDGIKYKVISLSFTGPLKNSLNFINHITWGKYLIAEDKIMVSSEELFPCYIVFLKIYYIDKSPVEAAGAKK